LTHRRERSYVWETESRFFRFHFQTVGIESDPSVRDPVTIVQLVSTVERKPPEASHVPAGHDMVGNTELPAETVVVWRAGEGLGKLKEPEHVASTPTWLLTPLLLKARTFQPLPLR
jgi:hypothetical protein